MQASKIWIENNSHDFGDKNFFSKDSFIVA